ncbi:MAG TPA: CHAT domain-containing tetratricopeptide repeat protein [Gemmatimonadaceae bacterium]|nr:CHAT domain-containing tetratricopeptide repeat protein [Gemmatimonadaceae bacterium]
MTRSSAVLVFVVVVALTLDACGRERSVTSQVTAESTVYPRNPSADSILTLGESVYRRSEYDSADALLANGRKIAVAAGDSASVARADTWLALSAWKQGRNEEARSLGEAALAMKLRLGLKLDLFRSYNALGLLASNEGRFSDATALFAQARAAAERVHDTISVAKAIGNLGLVQADVGEFDSARAGFSFLAASAGRAKDTLAQANAFSNLGMVEIRSGDLATAVQWLEKARPLYRAIDYPAGEESVLGQLASAYSALGEPQRAIAYIDSALAITRAHELVREESEDLQLYAEFMGEAGDHQAALRHLARALKLADSAGLESRVGDIARAEAREYVSISRTDLGLSSARRAVSVHRKAGAAYEEMQDHLLVAEIAQSMHRPSDAAVSMTEARKIAARLSTAVADENIALGAARVSDLAGEADAVLSTLPSQLAFSRLGAAANTEADALRARAYARLARWPDAVVYGRRAVESLNTTRERIGEGPLRAAYTSEKSAVYADLVLALLQLGRTADAFEVADAARGKALLEHLSSMRLSARGTSSDLATADALLRRIDYLTDKLRASDTARSPDRGGALRKDLRDLAANLEAARREYEDRVRTVARADPRGAALLGVTATKTRDVQNALGPGETLLEYLATPERLFTFVVTRDTVVALSQRVKLDDLVNRVRLASQLSLRSRGSSQSNAVMRRLYDLLIAPVESMDMVRQSRTFVIVPHSALAYLPFAALSGRGGVRLIARHAVLAMPSASALPLLRASSTSIRPGVNAVFAPFPDELSGTRSEASAVAAQRKDAEAYVGSTATERQLRSSLGFPGTVHVASHAVLNQTNPMFSHIELARGPGGVPANDGSLDVHELLSMPVRSNLVYLSGCETGAGAAWSTAFRTTQDYATLSQAILYAGAQNVVATLWRIDDQGASVFARRFYSALARNAPVEALAVAQREMLKDPRYSAPWYWAGYTISGSGYLGLKTQ